MLILELDFETYLLLLQIMGFDEAEIEELRRIYKVDRIK